MDYNLMQIVLGQALGPESYSVINAMHKLS